MPLINLFTSLSEIEKPNELLEELSKQLSISTGKPEYYVMALIQTNLSMTFGGTSDPSCYIEIKSIGAIDPKGMSAKFCKLITDRTQIPSDRIYIRFEDIPASLWGWNGKTFG